MNDDQHPFKSRRNTTTDLPTLHSVLGDVLQAAQHPPEYASRRSSWHGNNSNSLHSYAVPSSPYGYYESHRPPYNDPDNHDRRRYPHSPLLDQNLRLPPLLYSPSSSMGESPLERSPGPYPPSSRENSPDVACGPPGGLEAQAQGPPMKITLKRRKRNSKAVTVVPCMIEADSHSPNAFSPLDLSMEGDHATKGNDASGCGGGDSGVTLSSPTKEGYRTLRIEVSGTKDGKLVYELDIPEALIKFDAPMPASPYDPHPCILCGHTFVSERHMNRHLLTHTDIKPYQCAHCGKSFARPDSMIRHKRNVHGVSDSPQHAPLAQLVEQHEGQHEGQPYQQQYRQYPSTPPTHSPQGLGLGLGESDVESSE